MEKKLIAINIGVGFLMAIVTLGINGYYLANNNSENPAVLGAATEAVVGPKGADGTDGTDGSPGAPGLAGIAGLSGAKGDTGSKGDSGSKGDKGDSGSSGTSGSSGSAGATGATGPQGPQGPIGPTPDLSNGISTKVVDADSITVDATLSARTILVDEIKRATCPAGYIMVPGNSALGTSDFCVMQYEASMNDVKRAESAPGKNPWNNLTWYDAKTICANSGAHLITNSEWMTIARNIESTTINSSSTFDKYANGHANGLPNNALSTGTASPNISNCDITKPLSDSANDWSSTCQLKGTNGNTSDYGYEGTNSNFSSPYFINSMGTPTSSELRTYVLSNKQVIWDLSGNLSEWVDLQCSSNLWYSNPGNVGWSDTNLADYETYLAGPTNIPFMSLEPPVGYHDGGIGLYSGCMVDGYVAKRGGSYVSGMGAVSTGMYALSFQSPSSTAGFRCVK